MEHWTDDAGRAEGGPSPTWLPYGLPAVPRSSGGSSSRIPVGPPRTTGRPFNCSAVITKTGRRARSPPPCSCPRIGAGTDAPRGSSPGSSRPRSSARTISASLPAASCGPTAALSVSGELDRHRMGGDRSGQWGRSGRRIGRASGSRHPGADGPPHPAALRRWAAARMLRTDPGSFDAMQARALELGTREGARSCRGSLMRSRHWMKSSPRRRSISGLAGLAVR